MDTKISVIMPVYNSEQYLNMAISSVLAQTFQDWELLIINDGSTDGSLEICREFEKKDSRIKVFTQENHGISYTRNVGIRNAQGEYLAFIDNDDEYKPELFEKVYVAAKKANAEIVKYGYAVKEDWHKTFEEARIRTFSSDCTINLAKNLHSDLVRELQVEGFFNMVWNGIYRTDFVKEKNLYFDDDVKRGYEDWILMSRMFPVCENIVTLSEVLYIHYQRGSHSTSANFHPNQLESSVTALKTEYEMVQALANRCNLERYWTSRAMDYVLEYLLIFEKPGCKISRKEEIVDVRQFTGLPECAVLTDSRNYQNYGRSKRMVSKLIEQGKIGRLVWISKVYSKYIAMKRKKQ